MPNTEYDMPWYVATVKAVLQTSGPIAVVALLLVWYLMTSLTVSMGRISDQIKANHDEIVAAKVDMKAFAAGQMANEAIKAKRDDSVVKIMRQMCINAAQTTQARQGCYE
jgi:hypothetical protein